jgi:DNA-binding response OmpR family regulator
VLDLGLLLAGARPAGVLARIPLRPSCRAMDSGRRRTDAAEAHFTTHQTVLYRGGAARGNASAERATRARWAVLGHSGNDCCKALVGTADPLRSAQLAQALATQGFGPCLAFSQGQLVAFLDSESFDLVVMDLGLDGTTGSRAGGCANGCEGVSAAALVRSVTDRTGAAVVAMSPPDGFDPDVLSLGVNVVLPENTDPAAIVAASIGLLPGRPSPRMREMSWGPLSLDIARREATWHGQEVAFTKLQFRLLAALVAAEGALLSRVDLQRHLYGAAALDDGERVVAHVRRIREKLEDDPSSPRFLLTVRGEGFRLARDGAAVSRD